LDELYRQEKQREEELKAMLNPWYEIPPGAWSGVRQLQRIQEIRDAGRIANEARIEGECE
jgi:hypothetical protein